MRPGRRTRRTTTRSAFVDEIGGAIRERRARGSARAHRRRGGSGEPARRWKSSNEAEREDDVGRRPAVRPGRRTRRTTTRPAHERRGRRRSADSPTLSRLGARSASPVSALREPSRRSDEESSSSQQAASSSSQRQAASSSSQQQAAAASSSKQQQQAAASSS